MRSLNKKWDAPDGLWARLVFFNLPTTATYSHDPNPDALLYTALSKIYATIDGFSSQTFKATSAAQKLWSDWYNDMVDRTIEQSGTFLESIYGKAKDRVARLALDLHLLAAAADNKQPDREVSASTMYHAIELGKCLLLETEKVLALTGSNPTTDPAEARILKFINRFAGKGWVTAGMVTHWWSGKTKPSANDILQPKAGCVRSPTVSRSIRNADRAGNLERNAVSIFWALQVLLVFWLEQWIEIFSPRATAA